MEAAEGVHVEWVGEEAVVLDRSTGDLHYLNPPAALAWALIQEHGFEAGLEELRRVHPQASGGELEGLIQNMIERGLLIE
jgi:hypothetical protein